eukprot:6466905-Amphidinium_carterae.1
MPVSSCLSELHKKTPLHAHTHTHTHPRADISSICTPTGHFTPPSEVNLTDDAMQHCNCLHSLQQANLLTLIQWWRHCRFQQRSSRMTSSLCVLRTEKGKCKRAEE